ncbi:hypothetical protein LTR27_007628 [Elasticomyces elasticus]|nr:hypothetical protein LTR27_007628 [Elasticomyces elasticus]
MSDSPTSRPDSPTEYHSGPPPSYVEAVAAANALGEQAIVSDDGRIAIDLNSRLSRTLSRVLHVPPAYTEVGDTPLDVGLHERSDGTFPVHLNIVIQVVGSRGDVQPFVALGSALQKHGHRVRLATHANFCSFVRDAGLEFYPIGGDPEELMAYMVKNPGLIPSMKSLKTGDVARKREMVSTILQGCWESCIEADPESGDPFVADAIIANPLSFAHIHCAEALGIPLHIVFTMPWTATRDFPHPLANITSSHKDPKFANYLSYAVVEWMTWQGLGDVINEWRQKLDLEAIPRTEGPMLAQTLEIPHTYCWSSALIAKPRDWPAHVDVSGFFFREVPDYSPPKDLQAFLDRGSPPVYVGFGSIVLEDADKMSSLILEVVASCGLRAIISRGWSRLGGPDRKDIFWLEDCPHEWLFQHVCAVVHHGGAGTTACGLLNARPTAIVPFFGDQAFWGSMVAAAGAGPPPIPHQQLNAQNLAAAIQYCQTKEAQAAASVIATQIKTEDGVKAAVRSFHTHLPLEQVKCDIPPGESASFALRLGGKLAKISKRAAAVIIADAGLNPKNLKLYRSKAIIIENRRWDPITGTVSSLAGTATGLVDASTGIFLKPAEVYKRGRGSTSSPQLSRVSSQQSMRSEHKADASSSSRGSSIRTMTNSTVSSTRPQNDGESAERSQNVAGSMALASGKSLGKFFSSYTNGMLVEMPLAVAEGFRRLPGAWGDEVKDYGTVTDWKSGGVVAGRSFIQGIGDGFRDVIMQPIKGGQEEGAWGATKGIAKGTASLLSKTASGSLGLIAYPGQGISKSLHSLFHGNTREHIMHARRNEGEWMVGEVPIEERLAIVDRYHDMQQRTK